MTVELHIQVTLELASCLLGHVLVCKSLFPISIQNFLSVPGEVLLASASGFSLQPRSPSELYVRYSYSDVGRNR